jgi:hypothetical protein
MDYSNWAVVYNPLTRDYAEEVDEQLVRVPHYGGDTGATDVEAENGEVDVGVEVGGVVEAAPELASAAAQRHRIWWTSRKVLCAGAHREEDRDENREGCLLDRATSSPVLNTRIEGT